MFVNAAFVLSQVLVLRIAPSNLKITCGVLRHLAWRPLVEASNLQCGCHWWYQTGGTMHGTNLNICWGLQSTTWVSLMPKQIGIVHVGAAHSAQRHRFEIIAASMDPCLQKSMFVNAVSLLSLQNLCFFIFVSAPLCLYSSQSLSLDRYIYIYIFFFFFVLSLFFSLYLSQPFFVILFVFVFPCPPSKQKQQDMIKKNNCLIKIPLCLVFFLNCWSFFSKTNLLASLRFSKLLFVLDNIIDVVMTTNNNQKTQLFGRVRVPWGFVWRNCCFLMDP